MERHGAVTDHFSLFLNGSQLGRGIHFDDDGSAGFLFDEIRKLFAGLPEAKMRGYKAGRFELVNSATGSTVDQGKYIQIWKRSPQGYWELHRDMWNSSLAEKTGGS